MEYKYYTFRTNTLLRYHDGIWEWWYYNHDGGYRHWKILDSSKSSCYTGVFDEAVPCSETEAMKRLFLHDL